MLEISVPERKEIKIAVKSGENSLKTKLTIIEPISTCILNSVAITISTLMTIVPNVNAKMRKNGNMVTDV